MRYRFVLVLAAAAMIAGAVLIRAQVSQPGPTYPLWEYRTETSRGTGTQELSEAVLNGLGRRGLGIDRAHAGRDPRAGYDADRDRLRVQTVARRIEEVRRRTEVHFFNVNAVISSETTGPPYGPVEVTTTYCLPSAPR